MILLLLLITPAQAVECKRAPAGSGWSWREIDGKRCWYKGSRGMWRRHWWTHRSYKSLFSWAQGPEHPDARLRDYRMRKPILPQSPTAAVDRPPPGPWPDAVLAPEPRAPQVVAALAPRPQAAKTAFGEDWANGQAARLAELAADFVSRQVAVIVA